VAETNLNGYSDVSDSDRGADLNVIAITLVASDSVNNSANPSTYPSRTPSIEPSTRPSKSPSNLPSAGPSHKPSVVRSEIPSPSPSLIPAKVASQFRRLAQAHLHRAVHRMTRALVQAHRRRLTPLVLHPPILPWNPPSSEVSILLYRRRLLQVTCRVCFTYRFLRSIRSIGILSRWLCRL
jgi:hypothetical protein